MRTLYLILLLVSTNIIYSQVVLLTENIGDQLDDYRQRVLEDNKLELGVSVGISLDLGWHSNGALRGFITASFLQNVTHGDVKLLLGGQTELEVFRGGLGTSFLTDEKFKINIEMRNTLMALVGAYDHTIRVFGKPAFVTVGKERGAMYDPLTYSLAIGTTFVNGINHKRNQQVGLVSLSGWACKLEYYNDGTPFGILALGDRYDRYWTGGGALGFFWKSNSNLITDFILRYDNYTGYQKNLYKIAKTLSIDNLPYKDQKQQMFNQARFQYKVGFRNAFHFNVSIFEPKLMDIQYLIHYYLAKAPFHPRPLGRRMTVGFDYEYKQFVQ